MDIFIKNREAFNLVALTTKFLILILLRGILFNLILFNFNKRLIRKVVVKIPTLFKNVEKTES